MCMGQFVAGIIFDDLVHRTPLGYDNSPLVHVAGNFAGKNSPLVHVAGNTLCLLF